MSETLMVAEINCETGEQIVRPFTADEIVQHEKDKAKSEAYKAKLQAEEEAKAELKASALAKLAELGLTEDEAKAIAG